MSSGLVVDDYNVSASYPGAVRRSVEGLSTLRKDGPPQVVLNVFEPGLVAVTTPARLPIDLKQSRLFANQTYAHVVTYWQGEPRITGDTYRYTSGALSTVPGKTVVFGGPVYQNYYHWMMHWLPRLAILKMLRPDLYEDGRVGILVDEKARHPPFIDFLLASGIDPRRFVWRSGDDLILEDAVLVSFGNRDATCPEVIAAMRAMFAPMGSPPGGRRRRLWISRQALGPHRRRVANMDDVAPVLAAHGFEDVTLETLPVAEQIALFQSAEAVAGVHGAGLTNMIFSPPDCRVVSIESDLNFKLGISKFYAALAQACGLTYAQPKAARAPIPAGADHNFANAHNQDYLIPPQALDALLRDFLPRKDKECDPSP